LAHQWWGNVVIPADYRADWIVEAMSNYSALQYLEQTSGGKQVADSILAEYRADLIRPRAAGELVDSYGPVTFDQRLDNNFGAEVWHDILYEKGTWIFHMLRQRMGADAFLHFQQRLLQDFARQPISNEDLRQEAARFIPASQPDRELTAFFDTWVYDTGIPALKMKGDTLTLSGVSDSYVVDIPLHCGSATRWVRATTSDLPFPGQKCVLPSVTNFLFNLP
jgi:aminopeptidase N